MVMNPLIECIPNFSEGRDEKKMDRIVAAISGVKGVELLHVDRGYDAHRTVVTFAGRPEFVFDGARAALRAAVELVDMRSHKGVHPRIGAVDVCPFVPLRGMSKEELVPLVRDFSRRIAEELNLPIYLYADAALRPDRRELSQIRRGQYEGLAQKMQERNGRPDYGPMEFQAHCGATAVGVRNILVAYNVHLTTRDVGIAKEIAAAIRGSGRTVSDSGGKPSRIPGKFKTLKAIGWMMEDYGWAQVSTNITDLSDSPMHEVYEAVRKEARSRGVDVQGSELIGIAPMKVFSSAAAYYSGGEQVLSAKKALQKTVKALGLDYLAPFEPRERVLEYLLPEILPGEKFSD